MPQENDIATTEAFEGTFSDGRSAHAIKVRITPERTGLRIVPVDERSARPRFWAWRDLVATGPLRRGEHPLLGNANEPDARLFITNAQAVPLLLHHAPQLSPRRHHVRLLVPMLAVSAIMVLVGVWLWFSDFSLARVVADMLPRSLHQSLGRALARNMTHGRICFSPQGVRALRHMTRQLAPDWPPGAEHRVMVAKIGMINAFTTPGGYIIIGRKLIDFARSPDEVAAVLAHEMGHAELEHPEAALVRAAGLSMIGMMMFGDTTLGNAAVLLGQLRFSRQSETAADAVSIFRMRRANADPAALAAFFERLEEKYGKSSEDGDLLTLFQTHPPTARRIRMMKQAHLPNARPILDEREWQALRRICDWTKTLVFIED